MPGDFQQWVENLDSPDPAVRADARAALLAAGSASLPALRLALLRPQARISLSAIEVLAQIDFPSRFSIMAKAARSNNVLVADVAISELARYGEQAVDALIAALSSPLAVIQVQAAHALGEIGSRRAVQPLMNALKQTDYDTLRYTIIHALGLIGDPVAIDLIRVFEQAADDHVRQRACKALQSLEGH